LAAGQVIVVMVVAHGISPYQMMRKS